MNGRAGAKRVGDEMGTKTPVEPRRESGPPRLKWLSLTAEKSPVGVEAGAPVPQSDTGRGVE